MTTPAGEANGAERGWATQGRASRGSRSWGRDRRAGGRGVPAPRKHPRHRLRAGAGAERSGRGPGGGPERRPAPAAARCHGRVPGPCRAARHRLGVPALAGRHGAVRRRPRLVLRAAIWGADLHRAPCRPAGGPALGRARRVGPVRQALRRPDRPRGRPALPALRRRGARRPRRPDRGGRHPLDRARRDRGAGARRLLGICAFRALVPAAAPRASPGAAPRRCGSDPATTWCTTPSRPGGW